MWGFSIAHRHLRRVYLLETTLETIRCTEQPKKSLLLLGDFNLPANFSPPELQSIIEKHSPKQIVNKRNNTQPQPLLTMCTVEPLYIAATLGDQHFGRYTEVAFIEGLFCTQTVHLGPGFLAVISQLALIYSGVAVKRGSTVKSREKHLQYKKLL